MKKALPALLASTALLAAAPSAIAQSTPCPPGNTNPAYCVTQTISTASSSTTSAGAAITGAGLAGVGGVKGVSFSFTPTVGAGYRFVVRFNDLRKGKNNKSVVVFNFLTAVKAGQKVTVHVKFRPIGLAIVRYAKAHNLKVHCELISHLRPPCS